MRFDRFLTLCFFHRFHKTIRLPNGIRIPILMYHSISESSEEGRHPYFKTSTSPRVFSEHIRILPARSYKVISLSSAVDLITGDSLSGKGKVAVITFDDGFEDFYTEAFPVLSRYGFCSTVFMPAGFISHAGRTFKGKKCLRWGEIRELATSGVEFGSHTVTHPKLRDLRWDQVDMELKESKKILEDGLGKGVGSFSYPYAFPDEDHRFKIRLKSSLLASGYMNGVTTNIGTATRGDDRLFLKRIPVNSDDDPRFFSAKLDSGYDWVQHLQYTFKFLKSKSGWKANSGSQETSQ